MKQLRRIAGRWFIPAGWVMMMLFLDRGTRGEAIVGGMKGDESSEDSVYQSVIGEFKDFSELNIMELLNKDVSIATKIRQKTTDAPSIVTSVTAEEIKVLGVRSLRDILDLIPGFEFSVQRSGIISIGIRGTKDQRSCSKLLVLVDGIAVNTLMYGQSLYGDYFYNLDAVERIEIIRGPGSAIYGRNAFNAVINLITKNGEQNPGLSFSGMLGNYRTFSGSIGYGYHHRDFHLYCNLSKYNTDNHEPEFWANAQDSSLSARWKNSYDNIYFNSKAHYKGLELNLQFTKYQAGSSSGLYITDSRDTIQKATLALSYMKSFDPGLSLTSRIAYQGLSENQDLEIFKPDVHPAYPAGRYANPTYDEYKTSLEEEAAWQITKNLNLLAGFQFESYGIRNCKIRTNYDQWSLGNPALYFVDPLDSNPIYYDRETMPEDPRGWIEGNGHNYRNSAVYLQSIYYPLSAIGITLGGRYDYDSEFKGSFNPRGGLVWKFTPRLSFKMLYGQAFRAPNCNEQYKLTGAAIGNKDIQPEKIKTGEASLEYRVRGYTLNLTGFYNYMTDVIYVIPDYVAMANRYQNIGKAIAQGVEIENRLMINHKLVAFLNLSWTQSYDYQDTLIDLQTVEKKSRHLDVSPFKLNTSITYLTTKNISLNLRLRYRSAKQNYPYPYDPKLGDSYTITDFTLNVNRVWNRFDFSFSLFNVFDETYYDMGLATPGLIPGNPYQPGRCFLMKVYTRF